MPQVDKDKNNADMAIKFYEVKSAVAKNKCYQEYY